MLLDKNGLSAQNILKKLKEYYLKVIISRTPYRISFFGGGTDYQSGILKTAGK